MEKKANDLDNTFSRESILLVNDLNFVSHAGLVVYGA